MLSLAYLVIAVVDLALLVWAISLCRRYPCPGLILATVPLTLMWFDNLTIGLGSTLGEGPVLLAMNTVRFIAHYIGLPMTFIAIGSMARQAGFGWAKPKWVMAAFCLLATYFIAHDLWLFSATTFYPSCFADTLRYTTHIADYTACSPDASIGAGIKMSPIPAITLSNFLIVFGIYLWVKIGWKWLALGSIGALGFFAVPYPLTGGIVGNAGEPIISGAIIMTAAYICRRFGIGETSG
ncbi:MAG: hypothetical protein QGH93_04020 [Gammaproteobacteria bacterium]|jgi:hypothetical protein|nr:hypothetical protein [Gammaproteobacteria bacterium]